MNGQQVLIHPNGNGNKIPFHSRIGTKLIGCFLIIATITASVGYLSLYYSQTVAEKFQELGSQTLPTIDSLKEMKTAAIHIETATNEYVFIPGINRSKYLQEINAQTNEFSNNLNKYETLVNTYFPHENDHLEIISKLANLFISNTDKLVNLRQTAASETTLPMTTAQQILTIKQESEPDALMSAIDDTISDEVTEIAERTNTVNTVY